MKRMKLATVLGAWLAACSADESALDGAARPPASESTDVGDVPELASHEAALTVASSCPPGTADLLRSMQSDIAWYYFHAADAYRREPYSEIALEAFGDPDGYTFATVRDNMFIVALSLAADSSTTPVRYGCLSTNRCGKSAAKAGPGTYAGRVDLCPAFFALPRELQVSTLIHEYMHWVTSTNDFYCECALSLATTDPYAAAMNPDNYQIYVSWLHDLVSMCDAREGC